MGGLDSVGDAVTGGLLARAVEPQAGEADGHTHEKSCLNCGMPLKGPYCSACGQKAHVHRTVRGFLQDFVQGLFNFEGKFWRTLPMLAWCPGVLTRRYIAGERARYISPVALYLFTVFAMFAVLNLTGTLGSTHTKVNGKSVEQAMQTSVAKQKQELATLKKKRAAEAAAGKDASRLDEEIADRGKAITATERIALGKNPVTGSDEGNVPALLRPLIKSAKEDPELLSAKIQDAASKFSWMLIPISVPFLWLLFPLRRRYNAYDHAVFVTYSLSFMMMLLIVGGLLAAAGFSGVAALLFFVPPLHMYRQLRGAYELGRFSAVMRTIALLTFAFIAAGLFGAAVVAIGAMN